MNQQLTGRFYHKKTILGMVLMVEYYYVHLQSYGDHDVLKAWRKARPEDVVDLFHIYNLK
jgi:hypothetical protein